jgi:hypothetical protein
MVLLSTKHVQTANVSVLSFLDCPMGAETSLQLSSLQQETVGDQISRRLTRHRGLRFAPYTWRLTSRLRPVRTCLDKSVSLYIDTRSNVNGECRPPGAKTVLESTSLVNEACRISSSFFKSQKSKRQ